MLNSRGKTGLVCYYNVITMSPPLSKLQFCGILPLLTDVLNASTSVGLETTAWVRAFHKTVTFTVGLKKIYELYIC